MLPMCLPQPVNMDAGMQSKKFCRAHVLLVHPVCPVCYNAVGVFSWPKKLTWWPGRSTHMTLTTVKLRPFCTISAITYNKIPHLCHSFLVNNLEMCINNRKNREKGLKEKGGAEKLREKSMQALQVTNCLVIILKKQAMLSWGAHGSSMIDL